MRTLLDSLCLRLLFSLTFVAAKKCEGIGLGLSTANSPPPGVAGQRGLGLVTGPGAPDPHSDQSGFVYRV